MVATSRMNKVALVLGLAVGGARAHVAAWAKGMYCQNGPSNVDSPNTWYASEPLVALPYNGWFMHGACKHYPPKDPNEFLILPAGGQFTVEHATDKAFTTLAYNGTKTSDWPDGEDHPANYGDKHPDPRFPLNELGCISQPNMHCKNEGHAAGTAFAIAYKSDINQVTIDDLVVFTVRHNTPYKRVTTYDVPKYLPECPPGGCICAWGWVPDGCGQANEYMLPYRCKVTNVSPNAKKLGKPQDPKWCEGNPSECYNGPKKMSIGNQKERNTVDASRQFAQANGQWATYTYNDKLGFSNGAQENIYEQGSDDNKPDTPSTSAPKPTGNNTTKSSSAPPKSTTTTESADPKPTSSEEENNDDKPAVDPSGSGSNTSTNTGSNSSLTTGNSKKKCRAYLGKRAALRKRSAHAQRRRGALSFLDHFKI